MAEKQREEDKTSLGVDAVVSQQKFKFWKECYLKAYEGITKHSKWNGVEYAEARKMANKALKEYEKAKTRIVG